MWMFKHKFYADETLSCYKTHLVANGSSQQLVIDCDETFSPVVKPATIRTVLSLAVSRKWPIHQLDLKNAFLNGDLSETVYMHQPLGFVDPRYPHHVYLQQKSLCDADWVGCPSTRRSTSCYYVFLEDNLLSWSSKRQQTISRSNAEAEYRGVANVVAETAWLRNLLRELHSPLFATTLVYCDNVSATYLSANPGQHQRTKHIEIDIHFVRDLVTAGQVRVLHVPSRYQAKGIKQHNNSCFNHQESAMDAEFEDFRSSLSFKPPIKWAIEGDENSKYYHGVLNKKRGRFAIRGVLVDGIWMESPSLVKNEFFDHFKSRFEQPLQNRIQLERDFLNRSTTNQNEDLEREVSKEEIKKAVWDCGIDKAPGPDGFTFDFYRRYWNLIESDVVDAVKWFFQQGTILKGGNSSFITLIPKVSNANMVKDFRPISLIGSLYKIIAKILANRLVMVLGDLVNEIQSAFMADRQILYGPFILNELVQWCKKKKKQAMIFNVDFEKAYDSTLLIGGRLTLRKSVLDAIPIYHMSIFKVPMKVLQNMESIRSLFFNGADINSKKPSWVRWKNVTASKDTGGFGVSSLFALNRALMFKWVWRFISQNLSLWASVIKALHGEDGKIGKKIKTSYPSILLSIIHEVELLKSQGIDLPSFIIPKLGNGMNTSFWDVAWREDVAFKVLVPRLYALETMKNIDVASKLSHGSGEFSVSSVRKVIDATLLPKGTTKTRWIQAVPIKINVHSWKVKHNCLPTRVNISRRRMKITRWWDMDYMEINSFEEWLEYVSSIRLPLKQKQIFEGIQPLIIKCMTPVLASSHGTSPRIPRVIDIGCGVKHSRLNHISHPHCKALKTVPEAGKSSISRDGSVFVYNPDVLREQFAGLVIQRGLPFNHFDDEQTTRVFQNHLQLKYNHVSRTTLKRDAIKLWVAAKQAIIDGFLNLNTNVNLTTDVCGASSSRASGGNQMNRLLYRLKEHTNKKARSDPSLSSEYERYVHSNFVTHLENNEFATFDLFGFWKAKESIFLVLSHMAMDTISIQATLVASESVFSTSEMVLSIRSTRLTPASLELCMCLNDHLDAQERKHDKSSIENLVDFEEEILNADVQQNEAILLSDEEIALDAASCEGTMSGSGSGGEERKCVKAKERALLLFFEQRRGLEGEKSKVAYVLTVWNQLQPTYVANIWTEASNKQFGSVPHALQFRPSPVEYKSSNDKESRHISKK
nr:RNA-directed DNA polymerase, eukaryota, reverse transcriptase zinc-binding domain protein [Tanacetum cinerariifolium]